MPANLPNLSGMKAAPMEPLKEVIMTMAQIIRDMYLFPSENVCTIKNHHDNKWCGYVTKPSSAAQVTAVLQRIGCPHTVPCRDVKHELN